MSLVHRRVGRRALRETGMSLGTIVVAALFLALVMTGSRPAAAGTAMPQQDEAVPLEVAVVLEPASTSVVLGDRLELNITVANDGAAATPPLVLHLDVLDPDSDGSVDPEDWTTTLTRPIAEIPPGGSTDVPWTIQPISAGTFTVYAVVVRPTGPGLSVSNVTEVTVEDQRSLNPGNILPLAIAAPVLVGGALALQLTSVRRSERRGRGTSAEDAEGVII